MKPKIILPAIAAVALFSCATPSATPTEGKAPQNQQIAALTAINSNFEKLSATVDSMTATLSEAEQHRAAFFLVSAYSLMMQAVVERGNPGYPMISEWMEPPRKFGGDNPYTIYSQIPISTEFTYRLTAKIGSAIYLGVQAYGSAQGFNIPTEGISIDKMKLNTDGSFDLYIGRNRPAEAINFLQISDGDHAAIVRQYFDSRVGNIPATIAIVRVDDNPSTGPTYLQRLTKGIDMINDYIMGTIEVSTLLSEGAYNNYAPKDAVVRQPKYGGALYPTKDNRYEGCWVDLKEGQAMRVHGYLPKDTPYASYVFYDRWYNTPSYPEVNCFRTMDELALNADGSFDIYISPETINHPNWLNTGGLYVGSYSTRYLLSKETVFPTIDLVDIRDIPSYKQKK